MILVGFEPYSKWCLEIFTLSISSEERFDGANPYFPTGLGREVDGWPV